MSAKFVSKNPLASWCSVECATKLALKKLDQQKVKQAQQVRKDWVEKKKVYRAELGAGKQTNDPLQMVINKLVRLLDADMPCLARPTEQNFHYDSGHIFSCGSWPSLRYNLWNIHKQSVKSNRDLGGESLLMLEGLENRYGVEAVDKLKQLKSEYNSLKLTEDEKGHAIRRVRELIKRAESGEYLSRDFCNKYIGIYN